MESSDQEVCNIGPIPSHVIGELRQTAETKIPVNVGFLASMCHAATWLHPLLDELEALQSECRGLKIELGVAIEATTAAPVDSTPEAVQKDADAALENLAKTPTQEQGG